MYPIKSTLYITIVTMLTLLYTTTYTSNLTPQQKKIAAQRAAQKKQAELAAKRTAPRAPVRPPVPARRQTPPPRVAAQPTRGRVPARPATPARSPVQARPIVKPPARPVAQPVRRAPVRPAVPARPATPARSPVQARATAQPVRRAPVRPTAPVRPAPPTRAVPTRGPTAQPSRTPPAKQIIKPQPTAPVIPVTPVQATPSNISLQEAYKKLYHTQEIIFRVILISPTGKQQIVPIDAVGLGMSGGADTTVKNLKFLINGLGYVNDEDQIAQTTYRDKILDNQEKIEQIMTDLTIPIYMTIEKKTVTREEEKKAASEENRAVIELTPENFDAIVKKATKPVVVDFYATWCGPCKAMKPIFRELAQEESNWIFTALDVDKDPTIGEKYGVEGMPTFVVFKDGEPIGKIGGKKQKKPLMDELNTIVRTKSITPSQPQPITASTSPLAEEEKKKKADADAAAAVLAKQEEERKATELAAAQTERKRKEQEEAERSAAEEKRKNEERDAAIAQAERERRWTFFDKEQEETDRKIAQIERERKALATTAKEPYKIVFELAEQQEAAECGYNAVYNGWSMYEGSYGRSIPTSRIATIDEWKTIIINFRTKKEEENKKVIDETLKALAASPAPIEQQKATLEKKLRGAQAFRNRPAGGQWLDDGEIKLLLKKTNIPETDYTIVPEITSYGDPILAKTLPLLAPDALPELTKTDGARHLFILGNARHATIASSGGWGHWIADLAQREAGQIMYHVKDSLGNHSSMAQALATYVENASQQKPVEFASKGADHLARAQEYYIQSLNDPNLARPAMRPLENLISEAQNENGLPFVKENLTKITALLDSLEKTHPTLSDVIDRIKTLKATLARLFPSTALSTPPPASQEPLISTLTTKLDAIEKETEARAALVQLEGLIQNATDYTTLKPYQKRIGDLFEKLKRDIPASNSALLSRINQLEQLFQGIMETL